jgi:hypothetical protein
MSTRKFAPGQTVTYTTMGASARETVSFDVEYIRPLTVRERRQYFTTSPMALVYAPWAQREIHVLADYLTGPGLAAAG